MWNRAKKCRKCTRPPWTPPPTEVWEVEFCYECLPELLQAVTPFTYETLTLRNQLDGNLVLYQGWEPLWNSGTIRGKEQAK